MKHYLSGSSMFDYDAIIHLGEKAETFPLGEGWEIALRSLANYPLGSKLYEVEICGTEYAILTNADPMNQKGNEWKDKYFFTTVYVDDLIELHKMGYISGIKLISRHKYDLNMFNSLHNKGCELNEAGDLVYYTKNEETGELTKRIWENPKIENYLGESDIEEWDENYRKELIRQYEKWNRDYIEIKKHISLTEKGWDKFIEIAQKFYIPKRIKSLVDPLINIKYYDTATREVTIDFESEMKKFHDTDKYGEKLINLHIGDCIQANDGFFNAGLKVYKQELLTMNKFIRNEFIHNKFAINEKNYNAILFRQCELYRMMKQAFSKLKEYKHLSAPSK